MAYSGKGVLQNSYVAAPGPKMSDLYTRTTDNSKPHSYRYQDGVIPDVIFVFIGRNDYSRIKPPNTDLFVKAYIEMLLVVLRDVLVVAPKARPLIINVCDTEFSMEICENIKTAIKEVSHSYG
jgi:lysophospholipase L1-like esterase